MKGLFIGICTVDIQLYLNEYPASNTKNKVFSTRIDTGGPATNAANTFSLLGGKASLVTMIGRNEFRRFMLNKLSENNIKVIDMIDDINSPPDLSVIISSLKNGERTVLASHLSEENLRTIEKIPKGFDICLVDGFLADIAERVGSVAEQSGIIMVLDGGSWKPRMEKYLKYIDYAVCSSDFYPPGCKTIDEIISFMREEGIKNIAITRGEKSIITVENGSKIEIPVNQVNAVDTLGAGDVFHGAFCYYLLSEDNFVSALKQASNVATESCKYYGTKEWSSHSNISF